MNATIASFLTIATAAALPAQISAVFLVHHDFLPPAATVYVNDGSTGTLNDGTPSGSVTLVPSPLGVGVTLGGLSGDQIDCGPTPLLGGQERTVSVWARTTATTGIVTPLAFGTNPGFGTKWDMDIDCANGGVLELGVSGGRTTGTGTACNDGQWHMLTMVLPAGGTTINQVRVFVDGLFAYTGSGTQVVNTGVGPVVVGRSANPSPTIQFFPGDVDDPVLWSVALGDDQVKCLYDVGSSLALQYGAYEFEQLLEVYRTNLPEVTFAGRTWRRAAGLPGAAGLTLLPNGGYMLVMDSLTGDGVATPNATFATSGTGCASPVGVATLSAPQLPVLGATLEVAINNVSPTGIPLMVIGFTTIPAFPIAAIGLTSDFSCQLTVNLDALEGPLLGAGSTASLLLPLPMSPPLAGAQLFFQGTQLELLTSDWNLSDQGVATVGF